MRFLLAFILFRASLDPTLEERAFSGKYLYEERQGTYHCGQCEAPLFLSVDKYDSGAGWPSFKKPLTPKQVYYLEDDSLKFLRYRVFCRGCDAPLGHVFHDGPPPKNLRYCIQSCKLLFKMD